MQTSFRVVIAGGTGSVGGAVVDALLALPACREVVMIVRKPLAARDRVRSVVMDTDSSDFSANTTALVREVAASGDVVGAVSCIGVGTGSMKWSEEKLKALELGVVGAFAQGCRAAGVRQFCLLSAAGATKTSPIRYGRIMALKEENIETIGFPRLAIFRPGIIGGNKHTPAWTDWLGRLIPGPWGTIHERDLGMAFALEIERFGEAGGVVIRDNRAMRNLVNTKHEGSVSK